MDLIIETVLSLIWKYFVKYSLINHYLEIMIEVENCDHMVFPDLLSKFYATIFTWKIYEKYVLRSREIES